MTGNQLGLGLISATLYKEQQWKEIKCPTCDAPLLAAETRFNKTLVIINFKEKLIVIDNNVIPRMKKETKIDLINIVKLKLTKKTQTCIEHLNLKDF